VCPRHRLPLFRQFLTSFEFGILNPKFYIKKKKHYMVTSHVAVLGFLSQGGRHAQGRSTKLSSPSKATEWMLSFIRNDHCITDVKEWLCTMHCKPKKCTYIPFPDETRDKNLSTNYTNFKSFLLCPSLSLFELRKTSDFYFHLSSQPAQEGFFPTCSSAPIIEPWLLLPNTSSLVYECLLLNCNLFWDHKLVLSAALLHGVS